MKTEFFKFPDFFAPFAAFARLISEFEFKTSRDSPAKLIALHGMI